MRNVIAGFRLHVGLAVGGIIGLASWQASAEEARTVIWPDLRPAVADRTTPGDPGGTDGCGRHVYDLDHYRAGLQTADSLIGRRIRIAGYAYPLGFEFESVTRFILSPPPSPCPHAPPPPPNQLILVDVPAGVDITLDPVFVTGVLQLRPKATGNPPSRYAVRAEQVRPALIPDVR